MAAEVGEEIGGAVDRLAGEESAQFPKGGSCKMKKLIIAFLIFIASPVFAQELIPKQEERYNACLLYTSRCV